MTIDQLFKLAVQKMASDIHLTADNRPYFRINGELKTDKNLPVLSAKELEELILGLLSEKQRGEIVEKKELDLSYEIKEMARFRINLFWERGHLTLAARVIWPHIPTMEEILMPQAAYQLNRLLQGLVLVTGPAGCGKSTTLAAMIHQIDSERAMHIITLEDPIEFVFKPKNSIIAQRELGKDMLSFSEGLKHVVRQDPNVIMVGEMRDLETIALAVTLAETGHLVLATLHTINSGQTIDRIIDVFPPHQQNQIRLQLSLSLKGIISQQLLPKVGAGRIATREVLINNPAVANLIRENKIGQIKNIIQTGAKEGMFTMDQDLRRLYQEGLITKETALAHMLDPESLTARK